MSIRELERQLAEAKEAEEKARKAEIRGKCEKLANHCYIVRNTVKKTERSLTLVSFKNFPKFSELSIYQSPTYNYASLIVRDRAEEWERYIDHDLTETDLFDTLAKKYKLYMSDITADDVTPMPQSGWESNNEYKINQSLKYYPEKYILLDEHEQWLLGPNVFLNGNVLLLTDGLKQFLADWNKEQRDYDSFAASACMSVGERWRNSRYPRVLKLMEKINEAYER